MIAPIRHTAYGYGRRSTKDQEFTLAAQEKECRKIHKQKFSEYLWGGFFGDDAVSGEKTYLRDRPQGAKLDALLAPGDIVLVAIGDRAFRSPADCDTTITDWRKRGVLPYYCNIGMFIKDGSSVLLADVLAAVGRNELSIRKERQAAAYATIKELGLPAGSRAPWGWRIKGKKPYRRYAIDMSSRELALEILDFHNRGMTIMQITELLNKRGKYRRRSNGFRKRIWWTHNTVWLAMKAAKADFPLYKNTPQAERDEVTAACGDKRASRV